MLMAQLRKDSIEVITKEDDHVSTKKNSIMS